MALPFARALALDRIGLGGWGRQIGGGCGCVFTCGPDLVLGPAVRDGVGAERDATVRVGCCRVWEDPSSPRSLYDADATLDHVGGE